MKIEEIHDMWEQDCSINPHHLDDEALKTVKLHAKYIRLLVDAKVKLSSFDLKYREMRQLRYTYFMGECTQEQLTENGWNQYQGVKPIKSRMEELLDGDNNLNTIVIKKEYVQTQIYLLEGIMNGIKSRGWDIKNSIEFKKFLAGN